DEIAGQYEGAVKVAKVNIDQNPHAPTRYGVRGIPTFMMFKGGQVVDTRVGGMPKAQFSEWIEANK
ncbi:MAG: thiol reductase thioredoxin, partial [Alphaproteobacteria bacterium]|nr:thiol reductase thioredoxin [Alphaproteobacteria bacterium]